MVFLLLLCLLVALQPDVHAKKKWLVSQLAILNRLNVLQVQLVRVLLEQVLPHAKKNLAGRDKPYCVIWLHMHVFDCILEQCCQQPVACAYAFFLLLVGAEDDGATFSMRMTFA